MAKELATNAQLEYIVDLHTKAFGTVTKDLKNITINEASAEIKRVKNIIDDSPSTNKNYWKSQW